MLKADTPVARFLALYARETAEKNLSAVTSHFADTFLFAGPSGTQTVRSTDFAAALPKRKALFDQLGSRPAELTAVQETPLDSRYTLARTTWRFSFLRDNTPAQQFDTDSTFLIDTGLPGTSEADFKILLYLPHHDIMQILRDRKILQS
ncbi:MAG: hypothetical protein JST28_16745 [Acidobacteria bacterium]|nr:hypothetical protein [Acidobacteriota bacterium]